MGEERYLIKVKRLDDYVGKQISAFYNEVDELTEVLKPIRQEFLMSSQKLFVFCSGGLVFDEGRTEIEFYALRGKRHLLILGGMTEDNWSLEDVAKIWEVGVALPGLSKNVWMSEFQGRYDLRNLQNQTGLKCRVTEVGGIYPNKPIDEARGVVADLLKASNRGIFGFLEKEWGDVSMPEVKGEVFWNKLRVSENVSLE